MVWSARRRLRGTWWVALADPVQQAPLHEIEVEPLRYAMAYVPGTTAASQARRRAFRQLRACLPLRSRDSTASWQPQTDQYRMSLAR
jgi:hypothetical protein